MCITISNAEGCSTVWVDDVVEGAGRVAGGWGTFVAYGVVQNLMRRSESQGSLPCQGLSLLTGREFYTNGWNTGETAPLVRSVTINLRFLAGASLVIAIPWLTKCTIAANDDISLKRSAGAESSFAERTDELAGSSIAEFVRNRSLNAQQAEVGANRKGAQLMGHQTYKMTWAPTRAMVTARAMVKKTACILR